MNYKFLTTVLLATLAVLVPGAALADPITIVASVASISSGVAAWGTATGIMALAAGAQIAGGALSLLGSVTGNEKLAKIGGIAQLAGGAVTLGNKLMTPAQVAKEGVSAAGSDASLVEMVGGPDAANIPSNGLPPEAAVATADPSHAAWLPDTQIQKIATPTSPEPGLLAKANTFFKDNADTIKVVGSGLSSVFDPKPDLYDAQAKLVEAQAERERSLIGQSERDKAAISASLNGVYIPANPLASGQPTPNMPVGNTAASPQNPLRFIQRPLIRRI